MPPPILWIQCLPYKASITIRCEHALLLLTGNRAGARSCMDFPCNHRLVKNFAILALPTMDMTKTEIWPRYICMLHEVECSARPKKIQSYATIAISSAGTTQGPRDCEFTTGNSDFTMCHRYSVKTKKHSANST